MPVTHKMLEDDKAELRARIERLETENEMLRKAADADGFHRVLAAREAEIKRHIREKVALAGLVAKERAGIERLSAALDRERTLSTRTAMECERLQAERDAWIERLEALLERWVNIAEHGQYGDRTKYPLKAHPIADETRAALAKEG